MLKYYGGLYLLSVRSFLLLEMLGTHLKKETKKERLTSMSEYLYFSKIVDNCTCMNCVMVFHISKPEAGLEISIHPEGSEIGQVNRGFL